MNPSYSLLMLSLGLVLCGPLAKAQSIAAVYYTSTRGSDASSCEAAKSVATPKRTIGGGLDCVRPGDRVIVKAGTYPEEITNPPGGTSWQAPVTVAAAPGETVVVQPPPGAARVFTFAAASSSYISVEGLILDAQHVGYDAIKITYGSTTGQSNYIRIQDCEIRHAPWQGILAGGTGHELRRLTIHHNGQDRFQHGIYLTGSETVIEDSQVYENAGYGIHLYDGPGGVHNNIVRNNQVWGNGHSSDATAGIILSSGRGNQAYNNVVWNNKAGIQVDYGATDTAVYHNTMYRNRGSAGHCVYIGAGAEQTTAQNNLCHQNSAAITNVGKQTQQANNLTADPLFVDPSNKDFRITVGSPAIDSGSIVNGMKADRMGIARPQGGMPDVGAYEYMIPAPSGLRIIQ